MDEIHFLKSERRYEPNGEENCKTVPHVWGLTGTLTQNKPADLIQPFTIIRRFEDILAVRKNLSIVIAMRK